jgi:hypothetical protein
MRTTIDIDPAILKAAKAVAKHTRQSVGKVISLWARQGRLTSKNRSGLPTFQVPPNAKPLTPEMVKQATLAI